MTAPHSDTTGLIRSDRAFGMEADTPRNRDAGDDDLRN